MLTWFGFSSCDFASCYRWESAQVKMKFYLFFEYAIFAHTVAFPRHQRVYNLLGLLPGRGHFLCNLQRNLTHIQEKSNSRISWSQNLEASRSGWKSPSWEESDSLTLRIFVI